MALNEKLKNFSKSGKAWILSAAVTMAGIMGAHAQNSPSYTKADTGRGTKITHQSQEKYELHAGVLMPKAGEAQSEYEARRTRLEKQENQLKQRLAENVRRQLADAQKKKMSSTWIDALEDRLEEHETKAHYISYYTPEGQQKLKVYNDNQKASTSSSSASVRRGKTYDF